MASPGNADHLLKSEVKVEIDVAEELGPPWRSQNQCSGTAYDWSENNVSTTITSSETNTLRSTAIESDRHPASGQGIKAEPVDDDCATTDGFHQCQSTDSMEGKGGIKCEFDTCDDLSSAIPGSLWNSLNSGHSNRNSCNNKLKVNFTFRTKSSRADVTAEAIPANISNDVQTEALQADSSGEVQTEAVTEAMMTGAYDAVRSESISSRGEGKSRPAGDKQKQSEPPWPIKEEPQDQSSAVDSPVQPLPDNTSGSLQSPNTSPVRQGSSGTAVVLFGSLEQHAAPFSVQTAQGVFPVFFAASNQCGVGCQGDNILTASTHGDEKTVEGKEDRASIDDTGARRTDEGKKSGAQHVCDECSKAFSQATYLKRHRLIHSGNKPYVCDVCNKAFTRSGDMSKHKLLHTGLKPFACNLCPSAFARAYDLKDHKLIHIGHKAFVCDMCPKAFTRACDLKRHKRVHTRERPYSCTQCEADFTDSSSLHKHIKSVHVGHRPYVCDVCGAAFCQPWTLKRHKSVHTGEKPYTCNTCGTAFSHTYTLRVHKRIHTGEKPYTCDVCGSAFSRSGALKKHKRIHKSKKRYSCDVCGVAFARSDTLKTHKRIHTCEKSDTCGETVGKVLPASVT